MFCLHGQHAPGGRTYSKTPTPALFRQRRLQHRLSQIEEGTPAAVGDAGPPCPAWICLPLRVRHWPGQKAGIFDVGNEMENLVFLGESTLIYTTKCSPGWPLCPGGKRLFRPAGNPPSCPGECGLTFSHVEFKGRPRRRYRDGRPLGKLFWKDCVLENISRPGHPNFLPRGQQLHPDQPAEPWCSNVPQLLLGRERRPSDQGQLWRLPAPQPVPRR